MDHFELVSEYHPTGDQPQAIADLVKGFQEGNQFETLLGVTGSGKTFTMANVIQQLNKPTLIIAHNKTLAAQLYGEMKEFFPNNAVEYFVSYYDYYQPEAYVPSTDTYIEKDSAINDEIDKLRHSATAALSERRDVIIVASVSCIYGLGSPIDYQEMVISLRPGMVKDRDEVIHKLIDIQYDRNDMDFQAGNLPRPWGCAGGVSGVFRVVKRSGSSFSVMRWTGSRRSISVTGEVRGAAWPCGYLPGISLCSAQGEDGRSGEEYPRGAEGAGDVFQERGQASGGPADFRADEF